MEFTIMAIVVEGRNNNAPKVQEVLTKYGCIIRTRLGLHESAKDACSEKGLILLELFGDDTEIEKLKNEIMNIEGIRINTMKV
ncbi:hypothetical protein SAMN05443428_106140 [Caloramator quimbayensis]|uniref:Iron-only hydrogenase system regulator n=1 Tax=Caloramator quimbayensis TaxID=1147123 RepID=A0A1T4X833_9CLOT|nr:hypothetical protein [Caloramator quimbayensis]SKA85268.1 hypothetical protein SAMN05443428_106140 [Caloramator quimbayensis]